MECMAFWIVDAGDQKIAAALEMNHSKNALVLIFNILFPIVNPEMLLVPDTNCKDKFQRVCPVRNLGSDAKSSKARCTTTKFFPSS